MTSGSARRARLEGLARRRPLNRLRQTDCGIRVFTRPRSAPQPVPHCYPAVIITRWEWVESRRLPPRPQGYNSLRPNSMAPLPEILRLNGYCTAQFGKCHEVPVWEASPVGPFDRWPTGSGFEHFYGFLGGETNQWYPSIHEGTHIVPTPATPEEGYHFMADITDRAIDWVRQQRLLAGSKPFFMYFAPGATHAPHHVPKEWADKYEGKFDQGWDKLREESFARQKTLGVIPQESELTKRPAEIPAWDEQTAELKPVLARQMEVYTGFLEFTDHHIGRLVDALEQLQVLDDTLIYYIIGDNGASGEGTLQGTFNEMLPMNGLSAFETAAFLAAR